MTIRYLHTKLRVRDLDVAIAFYEAAFGYTPRSRRPGPEGSEIAFVRLPGEDSEIQLARYPGEAAFSVPERLLHLAFRVEDLDAVMAAAIAAGATLEAAPYTLPSGSRVAFLKDPDGYDLELVQKPR
ncbi:MAG: VOC family protein [Candidatus Sericytochromatia bacterium]